MPEGKVFLEGYRKFIIGVICFLAGIGFQFFTLNQTVIWENMPGFISPQALITWGLIIALGGNVFDRLQKPK